ncbi:TetR/AcrR family transcriptional regulator [Methylorubrum thiocyanatum]|uniref:TetR/AcrR family transcriptional regulator n=1 Tax=Methylorubrum thiocyanatum TaxID=47958 RepID=UPI00398C3A65
MATAYKRKKQPELVRRTLLDCAAKLALEQGLAAVTVQAVAEAAGVTKGGLFHHFPSKQALVEGVFADLLARVDADIDTAMAADPERRGAFTRAYVGSTFSDPLLPRGSQWAALHISALAEPSLRRLWAEWFADRLARHRDTDDGPSFEIVRLAADGAWLAFLFREDGGPVPDIPALRGRLLAMTRPGPDERP